MAQPNKKDVETGLTRIKQTFANPKAKAMIADVLPAVAKAYLTPERMTKIVLTAASRNPYLAVCTPQSILKAIMEVAPLGLEIGGPQGHVYLVPFFNSKIGAFEAVPIPGYMGYIELAYRTGKVESICADVIREGDRFTHVRHADRDEFTHEKTAPPDAEIIGFYCRAIFKEGGGHIEHMYLDEVNKIRERSKAKGSGPWVTDYNEMGKKTAVRRGRKYWPKSYELAMLNEIDTRVDTGDLIDAAKVIDAVPHEPEQSAADALADKVEGQLGNGNGEPPADGDYQPPDMEEPPDPEPPEVQDAPPEPSNGRKPREYAHTEDDLKKAEFITNFVLDENLGDTAKAAEMLRSLTAFKGRDKKTVPGASDTKYLSPKRLAVTYGNIKKLIEKSGKSGGDGQENIL